ncbi:unnamed protein product [Albugo candida]|uniref:DNA polymerase epsilon subunit n=1 Tax=Albugo candida TaxID=65357 RepID=A0A024FYW9_9STRA|nr:unnamed protein product [Albugo candida]|eukprot:CCI39774.1 unnamed protein product [Albugo candida]
MERRQILRSCKLQGLTLRSDALAHLHLELTNNPSLLLDDVIYALKNSIDQTKISSGVVSLDAAESALNTLLVVSTENEFKPIQVFNAFDSPQLYLNEASHTYELRDGLNRKLHGTAQDRLQVLRNRFLSVDWRVKRNRIFSKPSSAFGSSTEYIELSNIESLLGINGIKRVIGMLGQDDRKRTYLEDLTSRIYLELSEAAYTEGFFTTNCTVLVEGEVINDILHVHSMGFPFPESKAESLNVLNGIDPLGLEISDQQLEQMQQLEKNGHHATFIVLSDVHLDDPSVMKHLDMMFQAFENLLPTLFVLMGNFTSSKALGSGLSRRRLQNFKECFDELANLILKYPKLAEYSQFILVPGPDDPCASLSLPRHPLMQSIVRDLCERVPNVVCATNPCRVRYYTQDIVIFRQDLHRIMNRHTIVPVVKPLTNAEEEKYSSDETNFKEEENHISQQQPRNLSHHILKTIIDQGHLNPLSLLLSPVHWAYDSFLQLFPLPDVLIIGDCSERYQLGYASVAVFHPGQFYVNHSFVLYRPSTNVTEFSTVE